MANGRYRRPIIYTSADAGADISETFLMVADRKAAKKKDQAFRLQLLQKEATIREAARTESRLFAAKEKKEAHNLTILANQFAEAKAELKDIKQRYSAASTLYTKELGALPEFEKTDSASIATKDLKDWYIFKTEEKEGQIENYTNHMNKILNDLSNISRIKENLSNIALWETGAGADPKAYDPEDLSVQETARVFSVNEALIKNLYKENPELIPTAVRQLNVDRLKALDVLEKKSKEFTKGQKAIDEERLTQASRKLSNAPVLVDFETISGSGESEAKIADALGNIRIEGPTYRDPNTGKINQISMSLVEMIAPEHKINEGDSKDVKKEKKNKISEVMYSLNKTLTSFKDTNKSNDDIMGIGRLIHRLQKTYNTFKEPGNKKVFADMTMEAFNIDLTNPEEFGFLGYEKKPQGQQKQTGKKPPFGKLTFEQIVQGTYQINKEQGTVKSWDEFLKMNWEKDKSDTLIQLWRDINPERKHSDYAVVMEEIRQQYK